MRHRHLRRLSALAIAAAAFATPAAANADERPPRVTVTAAPESITAAGDVRTGPLRLELTAVAGSDPTGVAIVELRPGHTPAELAALDLAGLEDVRPLEGIGRLVAGATVRPGTSYRTTITVRQRTYAAVDVSHDNGPQTTFTVSGPRSGAATPKPDARIAIRDDGFDVPARLPATGVVRIDNAGERPHHALAIRIRDGLSTARAVRLVRDRSPQEVGTGVDLVGLVSPGTRNYVDVELKRGRYVIVSSYGALLPGSKPDPLRGVIATTRVG